MRTSITIAALAILAATPALAGVLPIKGNFCGSGENADVVLNANGNRGTEDGCEFKSILASGPHWWIVAQACDNTADNQTAKITVNGAVATISDYWTPDAAYPAFTRDRCH